MGGGVVVAGRAVGTGCENNTVSLGDAFCEAKPDTFPTEKVQVDFVSAGLYL